MDIKAEKKEAARFLNQRGRRIDFVFFGLMLIFVWMTPIFLYNYVAYLVCTFVIGFWGHLKFTKLVANLLSAIAPTAGVIVAVLFLIFVTLPVMQRFFLLHRYPACPEIHLPVWLSLCVPTVLIIQGTGISTCCPSTTTLVLALGPDLPRADQLYSGNLGYSA